MVFVEITQFFVLSGSHLVRREKLAYVDYQYAGKMEAHVGSGPRSEGELFFLR